MVTRVRTATPIILGNAPSTGSSLLRAMLGRHPFIFTGDELQILDKRELFEISDRCFRRNILRWLDRRYPNGFHTVSFTLFKHLGDYYWEPPELRKMVRAAGSYREMLSLFFAKVLRVSGARRWLEKSPSNVYCFDHIRTFYPGARFVHIVRDGRDCVVSLLRRRLSPFHAVTHWYYATLTGLQYRGWNSYYEIRYEDLVGDAEAELNKLCAFLGEEYTDALLATEGPSGRKLAGWRSDHMEKINSASVGQYRSSLDATTRGMFRQLRLSQYGRKMLPFNGAATGVMTPIQLQEYLGYGLQLLEDAPALSSGAVRSSKREFARWRWDMFRRYRRWLRCATQVVA